MIFVFFDLLEGKQTNPKYLGSQTRAPCKKCPKPGWPILFQKGLKNDWHPWEAPGAHRDYLEAHREHHQGRPDSERPGTVGIEVPGCIECTAAQHGGFCKSRVPVVGVHAIRALYYLGVYIRAHEFWRLPHDCATLGSI